MPTKLYDEEGNEVEVPSEDELKELKEKAEQAGKVPEYEEKITKLEEEKAKLEAKDLNFAKLRGKTKEERDLLTDKWSDEKKQMAEELAAMATKIDDFQASQLSSYETEVLKVLAGDDEHRKTKIKETAKEMLNMKPKNKDEILTYYQNAATLIDGSRPDINPVNAYSPSVESTTPEKKGTGFTDTDKGKAAYGNWFKDSPINQKDTI